jgi:tetratricopeptide (TPR) repeat protein
VEEEPHHDRALANLARLAEAVQDFAKLGQILAAQMDRAADKKEAATQLALGLRLATLREETLGDGPGALEVYERVVEVEPHHTAALDAIARLGETLRRWDAVAMALGRLEKQRTGVEAASTALRLATVLEKSGDARGFEDALRRAVEAAPTEQEARRRLVAHFESAQQWGSLADFYSEEAQRALAGALGPAASAAAPNHPVTLLRKAAEIHLRKRHEAADALPLLERAVQQQSSDRDVLSDLCDAYEALGQDDKVIATLEQLIESFQGKRTKEVALFHHRLGKKLDSMGKKAEALARFETAFKHDPGSLLILRDLGLLSFALEDWERAQKTFRASPRRM